MTPEEFNYLSQYVVPVLTDARPYGKYSMVDIDHVGGVQVIVRELLDAGLLNGDVMTCTGETLARAGRAPRRQEGRRQGRLSGREALQADRRPARAGRQPVAGLLGHPEARGRRRRPREQRLPRQGARVRGRAGPARRRSTRRPRSSRTTTSIIVRYEGPSGAPGMPEMLDPTSRITTLCRERNIVVALMTDARFSGGSVGLVIGHVGPEAGLGGPIAFIRGRRRDRGRPEQERAQLHGASRSRRLAKRKAAWDKAVAANGGIHPNCGDRRHAPAASRTLQRRAGHARRRPASQPRGLGARAARGRAVRLRAGQQAPAGGAKGLLSCHWRVGSG